MNAKPALFRNIALFTPEEAPRTHELDAFVNRLVQQQAALKARGVRGVFVSLRHLQGKRGEEMARLGESLLAYREKTGMAVGLVQFTSAQFKSLEKAFDGKQLFLFKGLETASLFMDGSGGKNVLVYDDDKNKKEMLASEFTSRGYAVTVAQDREQFAQKVKDKKTYDAFVFECYLGPTAANVPIRLYGGVVFYMLSGVLTMEISRRFSKEDFTTRLKNGFRVFGFQVKEVTGMEPAALDFLLDLTQIALRFRAITAFVGMEGGVLNQKMLEKATSAGIRRFPDEKSMLSDAAVQALTGSVDKTEHKNRLTKALIANLPLFVDSALTSFEMLTGAQAKKRGHKITEFQPDPAQRLMAAMTEFDGDLDGKIAFFFPEKLAQKATRMMLGMPVDEEEANEGEMKMSLLTRDEVADAVGEFANVIAGSAKATLAGKGQLISFTLPHVYDSAREAQEAIGERAGVLIDLILDDDPLYIFLTR